MKKTVFVLGAGKGCGNRVAEKFGTNGFRVVLGLGCGSPSMTKANNYPELAYQLGKSI